MPGLSRRSESHKREENAFKALEHVEKLGRNSTWKSFYTFESEPIGRGFAAKVYKVTPKSKEFGVVHEKINDGKATSKKYACKAIRRLRYGKDTIDEIKRELNMLFRLQSDLDKIEFLSRSQDACFLKDLEMDLHPDFPSTSPPESASPKLISYHEGLIEVAIVMELANGGSLYELCEKMYDRPPPSCPEYNLRGFEIESAAQVFNFDVDCLQECYPCGDAPPKSTTCNGHHEVTKTIPYEVKLSEAYVAKVVQKLLMAISYMHTQLKVVHLDIKAENVLLREPYPSTDVFITDFGLVTDISKDQKQRTLVGTPDYMAPEIVNYEPISFATDMWSFGVLTYFLLTGVSPFLAKEKQMTQRNVTHGIIPITDDLFANHSPEAVKFLKCLLVRDPNRRLTAEQCLQHPWIISNCSSQVESSPCSPQATESSSESGNSECRVKDIVPVDCRSSRYQTRAESPVQITEWSYINQGCFATVTVYATTSNVYRTGEPSQLLSLTSIKVHLRSAEALRTLCRLNKLNPVLLHLPELTLSHIQWIEPHQTGVKPISLPTKAIESKKDHCIGQFELQCQRSNTATPTVRKESKTYCVEMQVNIAMPTTQPLALEKEYACSALIYQPGLNSPLLHRKPFSIFQGFGNGNRHLTSNMPLLSSRCMSASLDCLYLNTFTSFLSISRTSVDSKKSYDSQLNHKRLCWQNNNQRSSSEVSDIINRSKTLNPKDRGKLQTNSANSLPQCFFRPLRNWWSRATRLFSLPHFGLHESRHTPA